MAGDAAVRRRAIEAPRAPRERERERRRAEPTRRRAAAREPLRAHGKVCYGLSLLHRPADAIVGAAARHIAWLAAHPSAGIAARFALALLLATASWHLFEKRVLRLEARFASALHPAGVEEAQLAA